jgi:nitrogen fixation/metabolism regulation signal transduction histidine kinase
MGCDTVSSSTVQAPPQANAPKRRLRNFLLDAPLQLKFAGYVVSATLIVAALLGTVLWRSSQALFDEMELAVEARSQAANTSKELGHAVLSSKLLGRFEDPVFAQQLAAESRVIDERFEQEKTEILAQRSHLATRQRLTLITLLVALAAFVLLVGLSTIVATHRVVGPLFRLKRIAREVMAGRLPQQIHGLRPKDELKDVFDLFADMVRSLREREAAQLEQLSVTVRRLEQSGAPSQALEPLRALEAESRRRLE